MADDFDIQINAAQFEQQLQRIAAEQPQKLQAAIADAGHWLWTVSKNWLTRLIYQKEIPRRPRSGRLAWRRTYDLRNAERLAVTTDAQGPVATIFTDPSSPAARYAEARHNLDRPSPVDGRTRTAPWRTKAHEEGMSRAIDRVRAHLAT
jgi:hypothetical protein